MNCACRQAKKRSGGEWYCETIYEQRFVIRANIGWQFKNTKTSTGDVFVLEKKKSRNSVGSLLIIIFSIV